MVGYLSQKGLRILANGFDVIPIKPGTKAPDFRGWENGHKTSESEVRRWMSNGRADWGIGIPTTYTPCADLDIRDRACLHHICDFIETHMGWAPCKIGSPPKRAYLFKLGGDPFTKISSKIYVDPEGRKAQVEILSNGQQTVAYAVHPGTKKPYRWLNDEHPETIHADELPELTEEKGRRIVAEFERWCEAQGWQRQRSPNSLPATIESGRPGFLDPDDIHPDSGEPCGLTDDEIRDKLMAIPNDETFNSRDDWLKIGFAVHHETGGSEFGEVLWLEWSEQHPSHKQALFDKAWKSFGKRDEASLRGVTFRYVLKLATQYERTATAEQVAELLERMDFARDLATLREIAADCRKLDVDLMDRARLITAFQQAMKTATNVVLGVREAREMVRYRPSEEDTDWLQNWVYLTQTDRFFNILDKKLVTRIAFDSAFGRFLPSDAAFTASFFALNRSKIPIMDLPVYLPNDRDRFILNGRDCVNLYTDRLVPAIPASPTGGDRKAIEIVEQHFRNLCPTERDTQIALSWLSYIAKNRDHPNWSVIIQGPGGDGKSMIAMLMAAVLGGDNIYMLNAQTLESSFNAWSHGHLLVCIEEINVSGQKYAVLNRIKPLISNPIVEIHPKGKDPYNVPNTQAYLAFTNYRDALPVNDTDRRYFIIMSRWRDAESVEQFFTDKPDYFNNLTRAIERHGGALRGWLEAWQPHPEFDAKGRAPFSHGRQQMAALNRSEDAEILTELLTSQRRSDITDEVLIVGSLIEELYGETTFGRSYGPRIRKLLSEAGFDYLGRLSINGERESVWSKTPDKWPTNSVKRGQLISKWIESDL